MRNKLKRKSMKINRITSTQEKPQETKMSINITDNPPTDKNINNEEKNIENILVRTESEENLLNAIKETENLKNQLIQKKKELESNKKKNESELLLINANIKEKSEKLENVSNNTKLLLNKLNLLNNQINQEYKKVKIFQSANKIKMNYLKELKLKDKNRALQGKKIILLNNKIIDKFKIQKEKLKKIIEEDKNLKINDYTKNLEKLNKCEKDLKKEVEGLRIMKKNHEKCIKINEELDKILERTKNEFNDEYKSKQNNDKSLFNKRKNSISYSSINSLPMIVNGNILNTPTKEVKSISTKENLINNNNNSKKNNSRNYRSLTNIFGSDYFIQKDLNEIKDQLRNNMKGKLNEKLKRYITSYSDQKKKKNLKDNKNNEKNYLFSQLEKDMLSKIIPRECLQIYQNKFRTIDDERLLIKRQLNTNASKKKLNEEKSQLLFITEKKDINMTKRNIELTSKISIIKKKINNLIKDIKIIQKGLENINEKYNNKKEENDKIKNHWTEFNDDIKNKKIVVKKGEKISRNDLEDLNKWGNSLIISINKKLNEEETCDNNNNQNNKLKEKS